MQRIAHGFHAPDTASALSGNNNNLAGPPAAFLAPQVAPGTVPFNLMFPDLPDEARLTPTEKTLSDLADLGATMQVEENDMQFSSTPAAYTYFAQFVDHDIAFSEVQKDRGQTDSELLADKNLAPWSLDDIEQRVRNKRTIPLQLESVYGDVSPGQPPPRGCHKFVLGKVCPYHERPDHKDENNDLVRSEHSRDPKKDRVAFINDARNDSNLIVSQIHVAFLRAHNAIADKMKCSFQSARQLLLNYYQWMVYHDLLRRFVREEEIIAAHDDNFFDPSKGVPLEFSVAAFRFGHSLVRKDYYLNDNFQGVPLERLFMLTVLSNNLKPTPGDGCLNLAGNKIIEWRKFVGDDRRNNARKIRPQMVEPLFKLLNEANVEVPGEKRLAVQDLKRGYMLRMPTGQALADKLHVEKLTPEDLKAVAVNPAQLRVLENSEFLEKTPLWFYILAEAAKQNAKAEKPNATAEDIRDKDKLGPVGGRIVAGAITGFIRQTPGSFLNTDWKPTGFCFQPGRFFISDLLRLAGVLEPA